MKKILQLCVLLLVFTCSDDDSDVQNDNLNINLVSGMDIRPDSNSPAIRLGNPNILIDQTLVFPNPAPSVLSIQMQTSSQITDVWISEGNVQRTYQDTDFESLLNTNLYSEEELNNNSENIYTDIDSSNLAINLEDFEESYYRVFIKVNETIEWHNIYVGAPDINELIES